MVSLRKIFALALVTCVLACSLPALAQSGLSPAQEAWLRSLFLNRTGVYDQAVINAASWTNFYKINSNELASLFATSVTNLIPVYGTNFGVSTTGHTGYVLFNTNISSGGPGGATNLNTSLWSLDSGGDLYPNNSATVTLDMWWKLNPDGDLTPRIQ